VVRGGVAKGVPAPWASLVFDSEGIWAVARNDSEDARAVLDASRLAGVPVVIPSVVLAETLQGNERDARVNQVLKSIEVIPIGTESARLAAMLKHRSNMTGVEVTIDALVVAVSALLGGGAILTSDPDDINRLASAVPEIRIRAITP
jgi:predicted nucleic acid-binding protein